MVDVGMTEEDSVRRHFTFSLVKSSDVGDDSETD
jgi:hypothetical protein